MIHFRILPVFLFLSALTAVDSPPPSYPDKSKLLVYKDDSGKDHAVKTPADWAKRRAHILVNMQLVMGKLPPASGKVPLDVQYDTVTETAKFIRKKLTFAVVKGDRVPAYLLIPKQRKGKAPAILCLHQTNGKFGGKGPAGLGERPNLHYAIHLAERGYVTLSPDYPGFGEYPFPKCDFKSGSMKAVWN